MNKKGIDAVLSRLMAIYNVEKDSDLARKLNVNRQTLASWRVRDSVPYSICITVAEENDVSLDWLLTGKINNSGIGNAPDTASPDFLTQKERCWLEVFRELPEEVQKNILHDAEKEKRLFDLEREVLRLKEVSSAPPKQKNTG